MRDAFDVDGDSEITLEANPESRRARSLESYRASGVNRLSFGVQSFRDEELDGWGGFIPLDRRAMRSLRPRAGFDNVSFDLMMWLPQQSLTDWLTSVDALIEAVPEHASLYLPRELYPNAPLREDMARAGWSLAPDEDAAEMPSKRWHGLDAAGYEQYEISNVARLAGRRGTTSSTWQDGEWLGFGCGAHLDARRRPLAQRSCYHGLHRPSRPVRR